MRTNWIYILSSVGLLCLAMMAAATLVSQVTEVPHSTGEGITLTDETIHEGVKGRIQTVKLSKRDTEETYYSGRTVGGIETKKHEFLSIVLMYFNRHPACGGTIIHEDWVMGRAHCFPNTSSPINFTFQAGKHDKSKNETTVQKVNVTQIIPHPDFIDTDEGSHHDICLFKVSPSFKFNNYVKKVTLPKRKMKPKGMGIAAGWGRPSENGPSAVRLQKVSVPIITNEKCRSQMIDYNIYPENLCAGFDEGGRDACRGDSGGPLYFKKGKKQIVVGINSWGEGCARPNRPGVYTRVTEYLIWMKQNTGLGETEIDDRDTSDEDADNPNDDYLDESDDGLSLPLLLASARNSTSTMRPKRFKPRLRRTSTLTSHAEFLLSSAALLRAAGPLNTSRVLRAGWLTFAPILRNIADLKDNLKHMRYNF